MMTPVMDGIYYRYLSNKSLSNSEVQEYFGIFRVLCCLYLKREIFKHHLIAGDFRLIINLITDNRIAGSELLHNNIKVLPYLPMYCILI